MNKQPNLRAVPNADFGISSTAEIIADIKAGKVVVLVDDEERENEGDLVQAAQFASAESINFMAKHGRGLICLTLTEKRCAQLKLPLMVSDNRSPLGTNFTLSIEAAKGVTTGISAADRARTVQAAVQPDAKPEDIVQPGHIFPLMAREGGVLVRAGHTEAGCDLASLAGLEPSAVICEILKEDGEMARLPDLVAYSKQHGLKIGSIADLIHYRSRNERLIERTGERRVQTQFGEFDLIAYHDKIARQTHLVLRKGLIDAEKETVVRVHEPITVLDFLDHAPARHAVSISEAMRIVAQAEQGVIVMLRRDESAGDFVPYFEAQPQRQTHKWDPRSYGIGAQILRDLGVRRMRVIANPTRLPSMVGFDLEITGYITQPQ